MLREPPAARRGPLVRLADLAHRRRWHVVLAWIAAVALVAVLSARAGGDFSSEFATEGSESQAVANLVAERFPGASGDAVNVVWQADAGALAPAVRQRADEFLDEARTLEGVAGAGPPQVSADGTIALVRLELDRPSLDVPAATGARLLELAAAAREDGLRLELGGPVVRNAEDGGSPELVGLLLAAAILLVAFGSLTAVALPIAVALFGLGLSVLLIRLAAVPIDVPDFAPAIAGVVGIGVGVDYALLVLTRFRGALGDGADVPGALREALATAGRSVLVAGVTVVISFLGLFLLGMPFLYGVAVSVGLAVLVVMAAAVTLLPALLAIVGHRVDRLRLPRLGRRRERDGALARRWSGLVQRHAVLAAVLGASLLAALASPALGMRFGFPDEGNDAAGSTTRASYDLVAEGFGAGTSSPLLLAAGVPDDRARAALPALAERLRDEPGVRAVGEPRFNPSGDAALLTVVPADAPQASSTTALVHRLREDVLAAARADGLDVGIGGLTASVVDQSDLVRDRLPLLVGAVVSVSVLFLLLAFRSPLLAVKAAAMNLLSVGAAYGVLALAADGGTVGGLLGIDGETPVPPFMPVMMFAVLFGLSMDYEVFLLSRVREEHLRHGDTSRAVRDGLARTARVITAAAAIMVAAFLALAAGDDVFLKLMGIGMATAILLDATVVRMLLVPALMQVFGRGNWWLPGWLDRRLPRLEVETAGAERR